MNDSFQGLHQIEIPKQIVNQLEDSPKKYNHSFNEGYRSRINKLYEKLNNIIINEDINDVIYTTDFTHKGLAIKQNINVLKQSILEFRLIYNEKANEKVNAYEEEEVKTGSYVLDNFDEIFENLSKRITGVNDYINELNEMQETVNSSSDRLLKEQEDLKNKIASFEKYRKEQEEVLKKREEAIIEKIKELNKILDKVNLS